MLNNTRPELETRIELIKNRLTFLDKHIAEVQIEREVYGKELTVLSDLQRLYNSVPVDPIDTERKEIIGDATKPTHYKIKPGSMQLALLKILQENPGSSTKEIATLLDQKTEVVAKQIYYMRTRNKLWSKKTPNGLRHYPLEETNAE